MPFSSFSALYIQTRGCHILRSSTRNLRRVGIRTMTSLTNNDKNKNNKVIIDTDAGVDDAQALMIALTQHRLEKINVIGITTVTGNVKLQRVIQNVARVQHTMNTNVPIFKGAEFPILGRSGVNASYWHGTDGLGDSGFENIGTEESICFQDEVPGNNASSPGGKNNQSASSAAVNISKLVRKYPGEVSIVAIGPLTNIALAILLDPEFPKFVKEFWWMGGSRTSGNITRTAEFNAYGDPEALSLCLSHFSRINCVDWQATLDHGLDFNFIENLFNDTDNTTNGKFMKKISSKLLAQSKSSQYKHFGFLIPDPLCMIAYCFRDSIIEYVDSHVVCETKGENTRGTTIFLDSDGIKSEEDGTPMTYDGEKCNVRFYTKVKLDVIEKAFKFVCSL